MAITRVEYKNKKSGTRYHADKRKWIGYKIDVRAGGRRYRNRRFPTKKEAEDFIEALKRENLYKKEGLKAPTRRDEIRVSQLLEKRLSLLTGQDKTRAKRVFPYFQSLLESDLRAREVKRAHFQIFINRRLSEGVKPEAVNREINVLAPAFRRAAELFPEELEDFECPNVPRPRFKRGRKKSRVVTESEKDLIIAELENLNASRIARMFEIAWLLGLRFGEVAKLKKTDFKPQEKSLRVYRPKTASTTVFEFLHEFICERITEAIEASKTEFIYTISGNYPKNFYQILKRAVETAGLEYGRENPNGITFHSNRHSFVTRLVQVTDIGTAASYSGHSDSELVAYYSHASNESRKKAMQNLYDNMSDSEAENLRKIFEKVKNGELNFDEFLEALGKNRSRKNAATG